MGKGGKTLGTLSPDPWDLSLLMPIPVRFFLLLLGPTSKARPSLVLAPESALRSLPSVALSSAPSGSSVSVNAELRKD